MEETHENKTSPSSAGRMWWLIPAIGLALVAIGAGAYLAKGPSGSAAAQGTERSKPPEVSSEIHVEVVNPTQGLLERTTAQAGTVMAFDWIDIYAEVSGYLKKQPVDRGSTVKGPQYDASGKLVREGDVLVEIAVPDLRARLEQQTAEWSLAKAQVKQKEAAIDTAKAEREAIEAKIRANEARLQSDIAYQNFRKKQAQRYAALLADRSIDEKLVDEQEDRLAAAIEAVNAAREAVYAAKAQEKAAAAKVRQAEADLEEAKHKVNVTKAEMDLAQVKVNFATIRAPFDGVITRREFHEGDFIRAATGGGSSTPLLTLQHTDKMRMIVPIPDRDVPYCEPGATASIVFDALPNERFTNPVSRIAASEDLQTKTMRVEIDIPNTLKDPSKGRIRQGMYGLATITLKKVENALSIPSACLVGKAEGGKASVYVVRDDKTHLVPIKTGLDNAIVIEVLEGLRPDDNVVINPSGDLGDDMPVTMTKADTKIATSPGH